MKINNKSILEYSKNLNVLYVEDDEELRKSTFKLFKNYFSEIDVAVDGQDGLDKYKDYMLEHEHGYDLVISDISMPNMDGLEMAAHILQESYQQSIIFVTAHNEIKNLQKSIDLGISGFITKPMDMEQIKRVLYRVSQAIYNKKILELHYDIIKKSNVELERKNQELEKSLRVLNTMIEKSSIVKDKEYLKIPDGEFNVQINRFIENDLSNVKKIHEEIEADISLVINTNNYFSGENVSEIANDFEKYALILSKYSIFDDLSESMQNFSVASKINPLPVDESNIYKIYVFLESYMFVLGKWIDDIESTSEEKLSILNASLIKDLEIIVSMWCDK